MISAVMVGNSSTVIFTAMQRTAITSIVFCNSSLTSDTLTVYIGDTNAKNMILSNITIEAGDSFTINLEKFILEKDDVVVAVTSNGSINAVVSSMGLE